LKLCHQGYQKSKRNLVYEIRLEGLRFFSFGPGGTLDRRQRVRDPCPVTDLQVSLTVNVLQLPLENA